MYCSKCGCNFTNHDELHICIICQEPYCEDCIIIDIIEICDGCDTSSNEKSPD